jgi:phosphoglycolate phosphatase
MDASILLNKKAIIWDWNGTLLDDVAICIQSMNQLLADRKLPLLTWERYREIFTFPVRDYYRKAGFDFTGEPFEKPALEFMQLYFSRLDDAKLHPQAKPVLTYFDGKGYFQSLLSAMEQASLIKSLNAKGVNHYFKSVRGISNHYADGKSEAGKILLKEMEYSKHETVLIGDSLHDVEVGEKLGLDVVLIASGHQSKRRLLAKTPNVLDKLQDLVGWLDQLPVVEEH